MSANVSDSFRFQNQFLQAAKTCIPMGAFCSEYELGSMVSGAGCYLSEVSVSTATDLV